MGLDDVTKGVGDVKSDKKYAEIDRRGLEIILSSNPSMAQTFKSYSNNDSIRLIVNILDDVIQDEIRGVVVSEDHKRTAENVRADLAEEL